MRFRETAIVQATINGLPAPKFRNQDKSWVFTNKAKKKVVVSARELKQMPEQTFLRDVLGLKGPSKLIERGRETPPKLPANFAGDLAEAHKAIKAGPKRGRPSTKEAAPKLKAKKRGRPVGSGKKLPAAGSESVEQSRRGRRAASDEASA